MVLCKKHELQYRTCYGESAPFLDQIQVSQVKLETNKHFHLTNVSSTHPQTVELTNNKIHLPLPALSLSLVASHYSFLTISHRFRCQQQALGVFVTMKLLKRNNKANDAEVDGNKTSKGSQKFSLRKNKTDNDDMTPHKPEDDEKSWWTHHTAKSAETEFSSSQAKQRREDGYIQKKVVFDQFGDFPKELLSVTADLKPKPESSTDVVIKVEVRTHEFVLQCMDHCQPI